MKKAKILSIAIVCLLVCLLSGCSLLQLFGDQIVTSGYFEFSSIEKSESGDVTILTVTSSCPLPIYKYEASLIFVDENEDEIYETDIVVKEIEISANEDFQIEFLVESDIVASASRFKLKIQGLSRERISSLEDKVYTITFKHGSRVVDTQKIKFGQSPTLPQMDDVGNEYFKAWCKDKTLQTEVSPNTLKTYRDTTYYAKYAPDLEKVEKQIKEEGLASVVTIYTDQIGRINNVYTTTSTQGSGVIVKIEGSKAYVLTNAHVVYTKGLTLTSLKITDSFGRRYNAEVSKRLGVDAIREDYDLALLEFTIIDEKLRATEMAEINPVIDDLVVAVGSPEGIRNSVTYGKCVTYQLATGEISLDFQVLWHDADITHGSSGGALFNSSCQLVGINYAGTGKDNGSYGIAIPIDKVKEFINLYTRLTLE